MKRILVLHGPNLNVLTLGKLSLSQVNFRLKSWARKNDITLSLFQGNSDGALLDCLHAKRNWAQGVVVAPGALARTSYALRDGLAAVNLPAVEVHWSNQWRPNSVIRPVCRAQKMGASFDVYLQAFEFLKELET